MSILKSKDYREYLDAEFQRRRRINASYSLRAYARDLGMPPSSLSEVLARKHGIGPRRAVATASALGLNQWEREHFCDLVTLHHGKSPNMVKAAKLRITDRRQRGQLADVSMERMRAIGKWHQFALTQLIRVQGFKPYVPWIAARLGIQTRTAKLGLQKLIKYRFLNQDSETGALSVNEKTWQTAMNEVPDRTLREFHCELLGKAAAAVHGEDSSARHVVNMAVAINKADLPKIKRRINDFIKELAEEYRHGKDADSVFNVGVHAFRLDREV